MCALVTSACLAIRSSAGLSVRPRSNDGPVELSRDICERGTEDEELVLYEPLCCEVLLRTLCFSGDKLEGVLRSAARD